MLCSNCRALETSNEIDELTKCENGHCLCDKCVLHVIDKCMICGARVRNSFKNIWFGLDTNDWMTKMVNQSPIHDSRVEKNDDLSDLSDEGDIPSMNILYSKQPYNVESLHNRIAVVPPSSKPQWNQDSTEMDNKPIESFNFQSKDFKNIESMLSVCEQDITSPVIKDTSQEIVHRKRKEICQKILNELNKPFENNVHSQIQSSECKSIKHFQTIGISTESTPKLIANELNSVAKQNPTMRTTTTTTTTIQPENQRNLDMPEYLIMNVEMQIPGDFRKKDSSFYIDLSLQQAMGQFVKDLAELPDIVGDYNFYELMSNELSLFRSKKVQEINSSINQEADISNPTQVCPSKQTDITTEAYGHMTTNVYRAFYDPPISNQPNITPNRQSQVIVSCNQKISTGFQQTAGIDATNLDIPRNPGICPISTCEQPMFLSHLAIHMAADHTEVPIERIRPLECKNFFLDPKLIHCGVIRCQVMLLLRDKAKNLGTHEFKDFVSVLVMTTRVNSQQLCCNEYKQQNCQIRSGMQSFIMIWLTGVVTDQLQVFFNLTLWAKSGCMPVAHFVHCGRLYSIRNCQEPQEVLKSGHHLLISENQIDLLTNNGRHMLEMQIVLH